MDKKIIRFVGIDDFNRPVFKEDGIPQFYGATDILFDYDTDEQTVLDSISVSDITYFGKRFNCEPMGTICNNIKILPRESK